MNYEELAEYLFPDVKPRSYYEKKYPRRNLTNQQMVTRFAPSPTGFVHMGSLLTAYACRLLATESNGTFILRIEDTDQKREVEDGISGIINDLKDYDITIDEGPEIGGEYGPYIQSERKEIYLSFVKDLIKKGRAYPCFCTSSELDEIRSMQELNKERIGYFGSYSKCRNLTIEEIKEKVKQHLPFVIRLKSEGDFSKQHKFTDLVKGEVNYYENDTDIVILKSDNQLPTYHFAHAVDDYLMGTTHVIRGDEWLSSLPVHIDLFNAIESPLPKYAHISPIMKNDNGTVRKLSKRKDPEASVKYYQELGIPVEVVKLYLKTIINTNFEEWYLKNEDDEFKVTFEKMPSSGALFDVEKLFNISRNYISRLKASEVYEGTLNWAKDYDSEFYEILKNHKDYATSVFNIEREQKKPRKDYGCYSEIKEQTWYMFKELFDKWDKEYVFQTISDKEEIKNILTAYMNKYYNEFDTKEEWFDHMKDLAHEFGYAKEVKEYKENPDNYKGHIGDISLVLRIVLTTKSMTPDLYDIMNILGRDTIFERYQNWIKEN